MTTKWTLSSICTHEKKHTGKIYFHFIRGRNSKRAYLPACPALVQRHRSSPRTSSPLWIRVPRDMKHMRLNEITKTNGKQVFYVLPQTWYLGISAIWQLVAERIQETIALIWVTPNYASWSGARNGSAAGRLTNKLTNCFASNWVDFDWTIACCDFLLLFGMSGTLSRVGGGDLGALEQWYPISPLVLF